MIKSVGGYAELDLKPSETEIISKDKPSESFTQ